VIVKSIVAQTFIDDKRFRRKKIEDKKKRRGKYNEINLNYFTDFIKEMKTTTQHPDAT